MGRHFGGLGVRVSRMVSVSLSPYELKPFAGIFSKGLPNIIRRCTQEFFIVVPPLLATYLTYDYVGKRAALEARKNPASFEHET